MIDMKPFPYVLPLDKHTDFEKYIILEQIKVLEPLGFTELEMLDGFSGLSDVYTFEQLKELCKDWNKWEKEL